MIEKKLGKTETQILAEAANETGDWPGGNGELQQSLGTQISNASTVIRYFGERRPVELTREVIEEYVKAISSKPVSHLTDSEIERRCRNITTVYDIYEEWA